MTSYADFLFVFFFFISLNALSQEDAKEVRLSWGKEQEIYDRSSLNHIIGQDEHGVYTLKSLSGSGRTDFRIDQYSHELRHQKSLELNMRNESDKRMDFVNITMTEEDIIIFSSAEDSRDKVERLYYQEINKKTLASRSLPKALLSLDYKGRSPKAVGDYEFRLSMDSTKIAVRYRLKSEFDGPERFGLMVFTSSLDSLWSKEIELPIKSNLYEFEDFDVSTSGDVYFIGKVYHDRPMDKVRGEANYSHQVYSLKNAGTVLQDYTLALTDAFVTDVKIAINQDEQALLAGLYSLRGTKSAKGVFQMSIHADGETSGKIIKTPFDTQFIGEYLHPRQSERLLKRENKEGREPEIFDLTVDQVLINEDGSFSMIAEQFHLEVSNTQFYDARGRPEMRTDYSYHYEDLVIIRFLPSGQVDWLTKVPKRQISANDSGMFSSFSQINVGDRLYLIYNDHPNNMYLKEGLEVTSFTPDNKEIIVTLAIIDSEGRITRTPLIRTNSRRDLLYRPMVSQAVNDTDLLLFGQRKRIQKLGRITFEK